MIRTIVTSLTIAVTAIGTIAGSAQAGDWNGRGAGYGHRHGYYAPAPRHYGYHHDRRDRTGEKIAKGVAIGVGALILGSILANEARRQREHREYDGY